MPKIALLQQPSTSDRTANLARAIASAREAARSGASLVAFAELAFDPFYPQQPAEGVLPLALAEPIPGPTTDQFVTLAQELGECDNVHLDATEHEGQLVFLHSVKAGPANQSYGLQVASLAGVPKNVIRRAKSYLKTLESQQAAQAHNPQAQLDFSVAAPQEDDPIREAVDALDPDGMSPRDALAALYKLKDL